MGAKDRFRIAAFCLLFVLFVWNEVSGEQVVKVADTRLPKSFKKEGNILAPKWKYLLHVPSNYGQTAKPLPLMIYLHGRSIRGENIEMLKRYGPPAFLDKKPDFPFVVVSPQLPDQTWPADSLHELINEVERKYRTDPDRIYLTGVSMGGGGSWLTAARNQRRFAAMAPVCGYAEIKDLQRLNDLPIWAFHGDADKVTPLGPHQRLIAAVNAAGGNAKLDVIPGGTHGNIIYPTYQRQELYDWFLTQTRAPIVAKPVVPVTPEVTVKKKEPENKKWGLENLIPKGKQHVVKRGDTLWRIGQTYGVTVDAIKKTNRLPSDRIQIGQVIEIPSKS